MNNPFDLGTPQTQGYKTSNANTSSMSLLTIINDGDKLFDEKFGEKSELGKFLALKYGTHIHHGPVMNQVQNFIHSRELALVEGLKAQIKDYKCEACKETQYLTYFVCHNGGDCDLDDCFRGINCPHVAALSLAIAELDEAITHLKNI